MESRDTVQKPFWTIIFAVFFGNFMATLSTTSINVALPVFMDDFHSTLDIVQWMMSGFMLATGVIAPIIGFMGDKLSYKRLYIYALAGFTLTSLLCSFAWSMKSLIAFRILQGLFSGIIMPTTMTIIYQVIPKEKQASAISFWSVSAMLAPAFGPTIGGWLTETYGWQTLFLMNIPIGIIAIIVTQRFIPYYRLGKGLSLDFIGFFAVILGTSSLLTSFSQSHSWGWTSWKTITLMLVGILILFYFILRSLKAKEPLLNLRLFKTSRFTYSLILNCTITISLYAGTFLIPIYLQKIQQESSLHTGLVMLPGTLAMALVSMLVGKLYNKVGPFRLILSGAVLMAVSTWALSRLNLTTGTTIIVIWIAIRYIGIAMSNMPVTNAGMTAIPAQLSGQASALMNWIRQGTAALSVSIFSTVLASRTLSHLGEFAANDKQAESSALSLSIHDVFIIGTVLVVIAIPLTFLIRKKNAADEVTVSSKQSVSVSKERGR
ncbi:MDR family MFS transporter [Paenibacillus aceris]|uniref:EmrB/QacA subfamily drug resistance transporter n=1 Tax=Paenibacillus aceris TaxID=869555 RepID=A0ABS4I0T3_9BACL|nr:EmrB/QacA subfamily drug resistance transporter [Paenibacillus aceris]